MLKIVAVFIGGGLGSITRYGIAELLKSTGTSNFPLSTLLANVLSCLILALVLYFAADKIQAQPMFGLFILVGFCGGFSTFSTFSFETVGLIQTGQFWMAATNVIVNTFACIGLIYLLLKNH